MAAAGEGNKEVREVLLEQGFILILFEKFYTQSC